MEVILSAAPRLSAGQEGNGEEHPPVVSGGPQGSTNHSVGVEEHTGHETGQPAVSTLLGDGPGEGGAFLQTSCSGVVPEAL